MRQRKRAFLAAASVAMVPALLSSALVNSAYGASPKHVTVAFVGADMLDPYYLTQHCGASAAAKANNATLTWQGVNSVDFAPEVTTFNAVVQKHPDAIVLVPFSSTAFVQPVRNAEKAGIKVVTDDAALTPSAELVTVHTNNLVLGALAADQMAKFLPHATGKVAIISFSSSVPVEVDRVDGFKNEVKAKYPKIDVVTVQYGGADSGKAASLMSSILTANPDLSGVFATDTNDAQGVASAILAAGKRGKVKLIGYDASPTEVQELKSGVYDALVAQDPYDVGYDAVRLAARAAQGLYKTGDGPFWVKTGGAVVTRANLSSPAVQHYLYKTSC
jgi:ribose transport system substrate-binding protein